MSSRFHPPAFALVACFALSIAGPDDVAASDFALKINVPPVGLPAFGEFPASVVLDSAVEGVQAWSFGVTHDDAVLELIVAEAGETTLTANQGGEPEFQVLDTETVDGAGFTQAVVLNLEDRSVVLPAGDAHELVTMSYRILVDPADSSPCADVTTTLSFSDALRNDAGSPAVETAVTVGGERVPVETVGGTVAVACPDKIITTLCEARDEDVLLEWVVSPNVSPERLDFLFLYRDGDPLATLDPGARSYLDEDVEAGLHEYTIITIYFGESASPILLFGYCAVTVEPVTITEVEPAVGNWIGGDTLTVRGSGFTLARATSLVFFADGEDPLPLEVVEVTDAGTLTAVTAEAPRLGVYGLRLENENGSAELEGAFEVGFVRGDANADRRSDISDAVFILDFLFVAGGEAPRCLDAGDVNDSGSIDISDAIRMLDFLFRGADPIPPPLAEPGQDPDGDTDGIGCLQ